MDVKRINEILKDLNFRNLTEVEDRVPGDYWRERSQGGFATRVTVYDLKDGSGLFLRVERQTDSYGGSETITSIQFVKPVKKTVTVFE